VTDPILVSIPRGSVNDDSAKILAWKVASGTHVEKDQLVCDVETSKAVLEIYAPETGVLVYTATEGDEVPVGTTICTIFCEGYAPAHLVPPPGDIGSARLSAAARAAATELGVDCSSFAPGSLVRREDVLRKAGKLTPEVPESAEFAARGVPVRWEDLPRHKLIEGRILQRGRQLAVQSSVTSIFRTEAVSSGLGLQSLIVYEAARLLHKYPKFNAVHDRGRIGLYERVNVGWALDAGQGLVVPVIPDSDRKTLPEISSAMETQLEAYLESRLSPAEYLGATFTVTDLSSSGVSFFHPLITPGQSAILGIGSGPEPGGEVYLTLAFDHQVAEGKSAADFLHDLMERLESQADLASKKAGAYCALCHRDSLTLQLSKVALLKSEVPPGYVCSLCVAGW